MSRRNKIKEKKKKSSEARASVNIIASAVAQIFVMLVRESASGRRGGGESEREREREGGCDKLCEEYDCFGGTRLFSVIVIENQKTRRRKLSVPTVLASACRYGCYYLYIII